MTDDALDALSRMTGLSREEIEEIVRRCGPRGLDRVVVRDERGGVTRGGIVWRG